MKHRGRQLLSVLSLIFVAVTSYGDNEPNSKAPQLKAKPNKCIALNKGQECYQTVKFRIEASKPIEYCLVEVVDGQALHCWQTDVSLVFAYEFVASETQTYYLREENSKKIVAETQVSVAWVYKSTKKPVSGWRLF